MKAYQLKMMIKNSHPPIWRRIIVPTGYSFAQLTLILNEAMGWFGGHLSSYDFYQLNVRLEEQFDDDDMWGFGIRNDLDQAEYLIDEFFEDVRTFTYVYDFGDNWEHKVEIEAILPDYPHNYPQVIKYKGNCPWEDCGGIYGYYEMLDTLKDPSAPDHADLLEWTNGETTPPEYDIEDVNDTLETFQLHDTPCEPVSVRSLYEDFYNGQLEFKRVIIRDGEKDFSDFDDFSDEQEMIDSLRNDIFESVNAAITVALADSIRKLEKNTQLTRAEIMDALELTAQDKIAIPIIIDQIEQEEAEDKKKQNNVIAFKKNKKNKKKKK